MATGTVSARIHAAHRGRLLLVAGESAVVGLATAITTLAAGAAAHVDPDDPQMRTILALAWILGALSWWMDRRGDAASVARAIDRRSGWNGALTTAFEAEIAADRSPVSAALARGLAPRISPGSFLAKESRASLALLAAPCLAAALLAAIREGETGPDGALAPGSPRASSSASALGRAEDLRARALRLADSPGVGAPEIAALKAIAERARRVGSSAPDEAARRGSISDLEAELARLERTVELHRAPPAGADVASAGPDGTMGGRHAGLEGPPDDPMREPSSTTPPASADSTGQPGAGGEGGVGASRWWPERYDGVVERWIEARRTSGGVRSR